MGGGRGGGGAGPVVKKLLTDWVKTCPLVAEYAIDWHEASQAHWLKACPELWPTLMTLLLSSMLRYRQPFDNHSSTI